MSQGDFVVPPRNWAEIDFLGENLRSQFNLENEPAFPILEFIEEVLDYRLNVTQFIVGESADMGTAEGFTDPNGRFIMLREDVYEMGVWGQGRARFTAAHELGHLILHTGIPLARESQEQKIPWYRKAEPQANQFAAAVLMPSRFFSSDDTSNEVARRHGVSNEAAGLRLDYLRRKGII